MTEQFQSLTPIEAINEFYRLKNKYETDYHEKYIKPILKNRKTKREKRVEFSKLPKQECINCKRNVGTIFNISVDNIEFVKKFIAKCGDLADPCPLDIQIVYSKREQYDKNINDGLKILEDIKFDIIKEKNNALFFNKDVVSIFETLTDNLKTESQNTGFSIESNILKNNNPEKKNLLNKNIDEFGKGFLLPFKNMISNYNDTNNILILNQAITFYINEMIPKLKEIQRLKYNVNYVEYEEDYDRSANISSVYKLIQFQNSLENTEYYIESDDKVLKFVKGVKKTNKSKTMKQKVNVSNAKKTTRKIKPNVELLIQADEEDEGEEGEESSKSIDMDIDIDDEDEDE
jgi:hypothetical protein